MIAWLEHFSILYLYLQYRRSAYGTVSVAIDKLQQHKTAFIYSNRIVNA